MTMKISNDTILIMAAAGIGLFFMTRMAAANANTRTASSLNTFKMPTTLNSVVKAIQNDDVPGQPGFGWQYFTDGTAIGPDGSYYSNGQKVWSVT